MSLRAVHQSRGYDFLLSRPPDDLAGPARRQPLILFLHGTAERGSRVEDVTRQGLPKLLAGIDPSLTADERAIGRDVATQFVVVAPQCAHYEIWQDEPLLQLLDEVIRSYEIDPTRVYLTGLSMGGFGTWSLGLRHPERFAAIVPVCGGGRLADIAATMKRQPAALLRLGIWAFHGAKDRAVPLEESERMIAGLTNAGLRDLKLTVYPEVGHDAWTAAYGNPEVYAWMLRHPG